MTTLPPSLILKPSHHGRKDSCVTEIRIKYSGSISRTDLFLKCMCACSDPRVQKNRGWKGLQEKVLELGLEAKVRLSQSEKRGDGSVFWSWEHLAGCQEEWGRLAVTPQESCSGTHLQRGSSVRRGGAWECTWFNYLSTDEPAESQPRSMNFLRTDGLLLMERGTKLYKALMWMRWAQTNTSLA